jgi:hypothetical protein
MPGIFPFFSSYVHRAKEAWTSIEPGRKESSIDKYVHKISCKYSPLKTVHTGYKETKYINNARWPLLSLFRIRTPGENPLITLIGWACAVHRPLFRLDEICKDV